MRFHIKTLLRQNNLPASFRSQPECPNVLFRFPQSQLVDFYHSLTEVNIPIWIKSSPLFIHPASLSPAHQTNDYFLLNPGTKRNDYLFSVGAKSVVHNETEPNHPFVK